MDAWGADSPIDDGYSLYGLRATLGTNVFLGRNRDHQPVLGHTACRGEHCCVVMGRLFG